MISSIFQALSSLFCLVLHVVNQNFFPKPLSAKDEKKYIDLLKNGDKVAKDKLIEHNLRLVAHITKKYYLNKTDSDDLISIGTIGLIKAINTFKPEKCTRLSSYAARCIENEILMHFRNNKKISLDVSMNEPIETDKNGNVLSIIDTISVCDNILDQIDLKINTQKLTELIKSKLSPRERIIIFRRYGLGGFKPLPQREVAEKLGISRSYVSRIEKKALGTLKKEFK